MNVIDQYRFAPPIPVTPHRYWRLTITLWDHGGVPGTVQYLRIAEMQLSDGTTIWPTSHMTSNTAPSPLVASASTEVNGSLQAWKAFDGSLADADSWVPNSVSAEWLQIDFGAGHAIAPTQLILAPDSAADAPDLIFPLAFTLEGSDTGVFAGEQELRLTVTNSDTGWTPNTLRTFALN